MTIQEIKTLLVSVDPGVQRYDHDFTGDENYTVWREIGPVGFFGDGKDLGAIRFRVDRYTKEEDDRIAAVLRTTLEDRDDIAVAYQAEELGNGFVHHMYNCEGI